MNPNQTSNVMLNETVYITSGGRTRRAIANEIHDPQKGIADLTVFTNENVYGCKLVPKVQFDEKALNLSASELIAGRGTENTWHRQFSSEQARTAGAGH